VKQILHVFDVQASKETVFRAISSLQGLAEWWTTDVSGEQTVGGTILFHFGGDFNPHMEITHLAQNHSTKWKCTGGHDKWLSSLFTFSLKDQESQTRVMFQQEYATELSDDDYGIYNFNWGYYLESLRLYCENGEGKPYHP
jgi:uncharacterized protein YndB with AHSA1/START domain